VPRFCKFLTAEEEELSAATQEGLGTQGQRN